MHALHHFVLLLYLSPSNTGRSGIEYPPTTVLFYAWCLVHAISISIPLVLLHAYGLYMYVHWQQMTIMIACNIATILKDTCMKRHSLVPSVYSVHDSQACSNFEKAFFYLISLCLINCCNFCAEWMHSQRYQVGLHHVDKFLFLCIFYCRVSCQGRLPYLALRMSISICCDFTVLFSTCSHM